MKSNVETETILYFRFEDSMRKGLTVSEFIELERKRLEEKGKRLDELAHEQAEESVRQRNESWLPRCWR